MSNSLFAVAIDCADATALARFWAEVLGRQVAEDFTSEHAVLLVGEGDSSGPPITFNRVPELKTVKNRLHLDLISDTFDAETARLLSLGAQRLRDLQAGKARWTTFADLEGNEFDLIPGRPRAGPVQPAARGQRPIASPFIRRVGRPVRFPIRPAAGSPACAAARRPGPGGR
jgi:catechol 2,3-dioxygenase-like lactoylglutathione lyase family enzyme